MSSALTNLSLDTQLICGTNPHQEFKDKVDNIVKSLATDSIIEATPGRIGLTPASSIQDKR